MRAALGRIEVEIIVVGLPLDLRGREGESARLARAIGDLLAREFGCPVEYQDERFTTKQVARERALATRPKKGRTQHIDDWAAAAILQAWLDFRPETGPRPS